MLNPTTLFVSAFIDLHIPHEEHKTIDMRIGNFKKLAKTGVPIVVFVSKKYLESVHDICKEHQNVKLHKIVEIEDTLMYKLFEPYMDNLPPVRYAIKDKFEFLSLMSAKMEFMRDAIETYGGMFKQYAWIDFNIWYIFKDDMSVTKRLWFYATHELNKDGVFMPGCWQKGREADLLWNRINWRFCGGFFVGRLASVQDFLKVFFNNIEKIMEEKKSLTWEVNIWSHLENDYGWSPNWFNGDHNESMVTIPDGNFSTPEIDSNKSILHDSNIFAVLCNHDAAQKGKYLLPSMPGYEPTSTSFIEFEGKKIVNVRFVNYTLTPQGAYIIRHPRGFLKTRNMRVYLDNTYHVKSTEVMIDSPLDVTSRYESIQGLEDIRLFEYAGKLLYIATQREFSSADVNRMIVGRYNYDDLTLTKSNVLEPPHFTGCEKNWIPIERYGELQYIYKWFPMQIGAIENGRLIIRDEYTTPKVFERMRGSSTFIPFEDSMVGVIHYSEEGAPRKYFHALVWLDKNTYKPTHISNTFIFNRLGIEFCTGFTIEVEDGISYARFWFSQHDKDPMWLRIPYTVIKKFAL